MSKKTETVQPKWAHLDRIAEARQGSDIKRKRDELRAIEASLNALPVNPMGYQTLNDSRAQISEMAEEKRAAIKAAEALTGDARVEAYCAEIIYAQEYPPTGEIVNPDGSPLYRGNSVQPIPGW
jgi:DNA repair ATPase RecN